jgi:isopenicillin N synthase-like dioxygenase
MLLEHVIILCTDHPLQEDLDWAELVTIDLAKFDTPEGKRELVEVLITAVREKGFFYVKNFKIDQELVNQQFALGREFYELPLEEKLKYVPEGLGTSAAPNLKKHHMNEK